jgi:hypothetical protein
LSGRESAFDRTLAGSAATLPLRVVAGIIGFPDWLGYLGVLLHEVGRNPTSLLRLGAAWAPQFMRMGGNERLWMSYANGTSLLAWRTLELAERDAVGANERAPRRHPAAPPDDHPSLLEDLELQSDAES